MNFPQEEIPMRDGSTLIVPAGYTQANIASLEQSLVRSRATFGCYRLGTLDDGDGAATDVVADNNPIVMAVGKMTTSLQNLGLTAALSARFGGINPVVFTDTPKGWHDAVAWDTKNLGQEQVSGIIQRIAQKSKGQKILLILDLTVDKGKITAANLKELATNAHPGITTLILAKTQAAALVMRSLPRTTYRASVNDQGEKYEGNLPFLTTIYCEGAQELAAQYHDTLPPANLNVGQFAHRLRSKWKTSTAFPYHQSTANSRGEIQ